MQLLAIRLSCHKDDSQVAGYAVLRKKFSSGQPKGYPTLKLRFLAHI